MQVCMVTATKPEYFTFTTYDMVVVSIEVINLSLLRNSKLWLYAYNAILKMKIVHTTALYHSTFKFT